MPVCFELPASEGFGETGSANHCGWVSRVTPGRRGNLGLSPVPTGVRGPWVRRLLHRRYGTVARVPEGGRRGRRLLAESLSPEDTYSKGKKILEDFGFVQIIEIVDSDNFFGESTYFAEIKSSQGDLIKDKEIVVILRASKENHAMEINIGCNNNANLVALQVNFDLNLRELIYGSGDFRNGEKLIELRCQACLQSYDKLRDWCPWCGEEIDVTKVRNYNFIIDYDLFPDEVIICKKHYQGE